VPCLRVPLRSRPILVWGTEVGKLGEEVLARPHVVLFHPPVPQDVDHIIAHVIGEQTTVVRVSKEATIEAYRAGLEAAGMDTGGWFEQQLGLSIIAVMATFLWEKALGDADELSWWVNQVAMAQAWLP
jgi:hypothetical protein